MEKGCCLTTPLSLAIKEVIVDKDWEEQEQRKLDELDEIKPDSESLIPIYIIVGIIGTLMVAITIVAMGFIRAIALPS